jgi:hypothetical protein
VLWRKVVGIGVVGGVGGVSSEGLGGFVEVQDGGDFVIGEGRALLFGLEFEVFVIVRGELVIYIGRGGLGAAGDGIVGLLDGGRAVATRTGDAEGGGSLLAE